MKTKPTVMAAYTMPSIEVWIYRKCMLPMTEVSPLPDTLDVCTEQTISRAHWEILGLPATLSIGVGCVSGWLARYQAGDVDSAIFAAGGI